TGTPQQAAPKTLAERYAAQGIDPNEGLDPTEGQPWQVNAAAGFGKAAMDTARGVQQLFGQRSQQQIEEDRRLDAPLMADDAGLAGNIVGQTAQIAVPLPAGAALKATSWAGRAAPYVGAAARAGAFGGAQGVGEGETRAGNAGTSAALGAAGQGLASGMRAVSGGAINRMEATAAALARKAEGYGLRLSLPDLSNNSFVRTAASQMERLPFSGGTKRATGNQEAFNRQVGKEFGADASRITPDVSASAKTRLNKGFEAVTNRNNLALNTDHVAQIKTVLDEVSRLGGTDTARMVRGWANELMSKVDEAGQVHGKAYQSFDSRLGKVLKGGGEPALYLGQLRDVVRAAMDDSISAGDRAVWTMLRKQWAALKTVEPLVAKAKDGNISPQSLMNRVTADNAGKARMATDSAGNLGDLARIGQRFLKESPNSGTADRALVNLAVGGGLFQAQNQGYIEPATALKIAGGLAANRYGLRALNSPALAMGNGRVLNGLARLARGLPAAVPATVNAKKQQRAKPPVR
ncbi:MAG TPA: hypothetical protein VNM48_23075, partial [Chloroflexota bacterium]|nr:hypothetical protein [Chloroflexota bacterium]